MAMDLWVNMVNYLIGSTQESLNLHMVNRSVIQSYLDQVRKIKHHSMQEDSFYSDWSPYVSSTWEYQEKVLLSGFKSTLGRQFSSEIFLPPPQYLERGKSAYSFQAISTHAAHYQK